MWSLSCLKGEQQFSSCVSLCTSLPFYKQTHTHKEKQSEAKLYTEEGHMFSPLDPRNNIEKEYGEDFLLRI